MTDEEAQDIGPAFDNNFEIEVDCVFMAMVHLVSPYHFIHALSMVSRCLAEAFAKNSKPKRFYETMQTALYGYDDVFSEMAFDVLL
jgi:hypothetical protein